MCLKLNGSHKTDQKSKQYKEKIKSTAKIEIITEDITNCFYSTFLKNRMNTFWEKQHTNTDNKIIFTNC